MSADAENLFSDPSLSSQKSKRRKAKSPPVFKPYQQHQSMLLPPNLGEMIPDKHLVRIVNRTIETLNVDQLLSSYKGGGASAYHPKMLLKVIVYAYLSKIYSSRQIAKALRQDIHFLWLSGMQQPEFSIINHFRSSRLKGVIDQVFGSMVFFLLNHGFIDLKQYFVDGTKLRADSNKHKVVWAKNTKRYKEKVQQKINELLDQIERTNAEEQGQYDDRDLEEQGEHVTLSARAVKEQMDELNRIIATVTPSKQTRKAVKEIENKLLPRLEKYESQEQTLAGRNSYAKTDPDATVFRAKDDQLLPAYNILMGTQRQFILNYSFHQRKASESDGLPNHLQRMRARLGRYPDLLMGDSGYGSEENYALLKRLNIGNYLKYNVFHRERTKAYRTNPYFKENFPYDADTDSYRCPEGRALAFKEQRTMMTDNGYRTSAKMYQSLNCDDCPVASLCKRGAGNRTIQINRTLEAYRKEARKNLDSEHGLALRKQRGVDVEPVFGDIKFNQGYSRCRLRSQPKVNVEIGLLSIAHNIKKIARWKN